MKEQTSSADRSQYPEAGCVDAARAADLDRGSKQHRKAEPVKEPGGRGGLSPTHGWKRLAPETMNGITCPRGSYAASPPRELGTSELNEDTPSQKGQGNPGHCKLHPVG